jgi:hypothetical protein
MRNYNKYRTNRANGIIQDTHEFTGPRREMGLDRISRTDRISQDKEYSLEYTGPRKQM